MKKYRCLWYKSTTNHNILYFVHIPGISFLNKGKCLWKAQTPLAGRGVMRAALTRIGATGGWRLFAAPMHKPSLRQGRGQGAETVQFGGKSVEMWTNLPSTAGQTEPMCPEGIGRRSSSPVGGLTVLIPLSPAHPNRRFLGKRPAARLVNGALRSIDKN